MTGVITTMQRRLQLVAVGLLVVGVALALAVSVLAFWPDLEASLFDISISAEATIDDLRCPVALTTGEAGSISAHFQNSSDRTVQFLVRARIAHGSLNLMRRADTPVTLTPGESQTLTWDVTPEDVVFGRMILARVYALRSFPLPLRERTCGIYVLRLTGVSGQSVVTAAVTASLVCLASGGALWLRQGGRRKTATQSGGLVVTLAVADMAASLAGWWAAGLLLLIGLVVVGAVLVERWVTGR